jgi:hypothetical protein
LKRPVGISVLAILLICLAAGGFVLTLTAETLAELTVKWHLIRFSALFYSVTAVVAAIGLWKMRRWGYVAFVGWVAAVLLSGLAGSFVFPASRVPWWIALLWIGAVALIVVPLARYVRRVVPPPA